MSWTYRFFESKATKDVVSQLINSFNGLSKYQALTAKMGHSDVSNGKARGLVFYEEHASIKSIPGAPGKPWLSTLKAVSAGSSYETAAEEICAHLNGLTPEQASLALFSMSDISGYTCHMGLIYPTSVK
ncbi:MULTISPECIES: hypothetical protein [unclassified Corallococcus]|uniref:hypothetical protein n=1 Tax=unclassified Corallococcus TaxID=2685029 RepID=UPI001A8D9EF7|nr:MULTISPECIES: hypothetical protein [unclassified Corallococcus]MBN9685007.1 hypothetical protein [Corallococcus sp. NCSPR001]WAS83533.1 hypothetical protein O0N60_29985 [Corallococcus sp. NCRR]